MFSSVNNVFVQVPDTICTTVEIPVPAQPKLHKQWCLFDQADNIDFDREVRRIAGPAEEERSSSQRVASKVWS